MVIIGNFVHSIYSSFDSEHLIAIKCSESRVEILQIFDIAAIEIRYFILPFSKQNKNNTLEGTSPNGTLKLEPSHPYQTLSLILLLLTVSVLFL